jgi:small subunit ribosomal protein S3
LGQKINPISLRLGITDTWRSRWYADKKSFGDLLVTDQKIRKHVEDNYQFAGVTRVDIERTSGESRITLHCARPGVIIGRKGQEVERLRSELEDIADGTIHIDIKEVSRPELSAALIAQGISEQLQKRASFRRVIRKAADTAMQMGARGVKIEIAGRLGGSEMRRRERVVQGMIPLHTLDALIDYGFVQCVTNYGTIGVKAWVCTGASEPGERSGTKTDESDTGGKS